MRNHRNTSQHVDEYSNRKIKISVFLSPPLDVPTRMHNNPFTNRYKKSACILMYDFLFLQTQLRRLHSSNHIQSSLVCVKVYRISRRMVGAAITARMSSALLIARFFSFRRHSSFLKRSRAEESGGGHNFASANNSPPLSSSLSHFCFVKFLFLFQSVLLLQSYVCFRLAHPINGIRSHTKPLRHPRVSFVFLTIYLAWIVF